MLNIFVTTRQSDNSFCEKQNSRQKKTRVLGGKMNPSGGRVVGWEYESRS